MRDLGCAVCTRRSHCMEDPAQCNDFDPDVESLSHDMVKLAILKASAEFKWVQVGRDGDALRIRVGVAESLEEGDWKAYRDMIADALTRMNQECLCLSEGTRMLLVFEEK